jgi:peptide/nickel transport system ATP-binding protein
MSAAHVHSGGTQPLLRAEGLHKAFDVSEPWMTRVLKRQGRSILPAVMNVSFEVDRGETMSLVGESGCGKSTIARLVTGLHRPDQGRVVIDGVDVTALRSRAALKPFGRRLQMIFQDPYSSMNARWKVGDIIAEPIHAFGLSKDRATIEARVAELLTQVGLQARDADKFPHEFSGGQRQRISIARALASEPEFLVLDEPTSALDVSVQAQILNLLAELQAELRLGYLFISHNLAVVYHISHKIGVMYLGRLVETGPSDDVFARPLHPYTQLLLDTVPAAHMGRRKRSPIVGEVPSPIDPPSGCVFHPRCPFAREICRAAAPELAAAAGSPVQVACHGVAEGWIEPARHDATPRSIQASS